MLLSTPYMIDICAGYMHYNYFDLQEFLLWNYSSTHNLLPYKDLSYPYGIFNYYKNYNLFFEIIFYLIIPTLFTIVYLLFSKIFKDKYILYFSFTIFYLFILNLVGFQTFGRYGLFIIFSLLISYILYKFKKITLKLLFYLGVFLGLFFSLINDLGIYLIFYSIFIILVYKILFREKNDLLKFIFYRELVIQYFFLALGIFMGIIPVMIFLKYQGSTYYYMELLKSIGETVVVAKTPFFSFIDSPANIFTISILYFALFYNFLKVFFYKHKLTLSSFFQITLIFCILMMEQKSMIRSIDRQITFVSLILLMFLLYEFLNKIKISYQMKRFLYIFILITVTVIYGLNIENQKINLLTLSKNYKLLITNQCYDNNIQTFLEQNPIYTTIINYLKKQKDFKGKVFSFSTGNSAFYTLLKQKPPYYNAIFGGSSYIKQNSTIKYIEENEIKYITLNTNKKSIHDGVPDFIRQSHLFSYILNNYYPVIVIGDHIILRNEKNKDFFTSNKLKQKKEYINYLLNVNLSNIPYSEGFHKFDAFKNNSELLIQENDVNKINSFLKNNILYSTNKIFVLIPRNDNLTKTLNHISIKIKNGNSTTIHYKSCKKGAACILNLINIPLFYKNRIIEKIALDNEFKGTIKIFDLKKQGILW